MRSPGRSSSHNSWLFLLKNNNGGSSDEFEQQEQRRIRNNGILVLLTCPLTWGTFEPAVRYVYQITPTIPPFVFSLVYYSIASAALVTIALLRVEKEQQSTSPKLLDEENNSTLQNNNTNIGVFARSFPLRGGFELGTYLFLGNGLQVVGLRTVPSDRAAFLLQLTTIFVPIVQSIVARDLSAVPRKTWIACLVALTGVAFIGLDNGPNLLETVGEQSLSPLLGISSILLSSDFIISNLQFSVGDLYIALGAVFYSFHCIRLELYAKSESAIRLAATKASTETFWCILVVLTSVLVAKNASPSAASDGSSTLQLLPSILSTVQNSGTNTMEYAESFVASVNDGTIAPDQWFLLGLATFWTGLVTIAYTIYAQSFGQARVEPITANLIYTTQPFFTAVIAYFLLGESLGTFGYVGGALIGAAVLLVVIPKSDDDDAVSG